LAQVLRHIPKAEDAKLLVGLDTSDDAAVYKINDEVAMIQTVDFFTPIVDDPYTFGQIAATNALSDVYAMGGEPKLAMNIVCFPTCLSPDVLTEILKGGYDKIKEAGAIVVGGHTIEDDEPKYGLSVTGFAHPSKILANKTAQVGDLLVITKPLGVGIVNTAIKGELVDKEAYDEAVLVMTTLNKYAKEVIDRVGGVNSLTDVTGFGLIGHAYEMAAASSVSIKIDHKKIPVISKAIDYANMGLVPAGAYANRGYVDDFIHINQEVAEYMEDILCDPQTSGGLLISIPKERVDMLMEELKSTPTRSAIIGEVIEKQEHYIYVE